MYSIELIQSARIIFVILRADKRYRSAATATGIIWREVCGVCILHNTFRSTVGYSFCTSMNNYSRANTAKVHLVYSFFAPWVNISATQCLKTTAERNRREAKEFAEKVKKDKNFLL